MDKENGLFPSAAGSDASRLIEMIALREWWPTATAEATNAFYQASEMENVGACSVRESSWRTREQDVAGRKEVGRCSGSCLDDAPEAMGLIRSAAAPKFFKEESMDGQRTHAMEVHVDDLCATGSPDILRQTFEHTKRTVTLKVKFQGMSGKIQARQTVTQSSRRRTRVEIEPNVPGRSAAVAWTSQAQDCNGIIFSMARKRSQNARSAR